MTVEIAATVIGLVLIAGLSWLDYETQASLRRTRELERILGVNDFKGLLADRDAPNAGDTRAPSQVPLPSRREGPAEPHAGRPQPPLGSQR